MLLLPEGLTGEASERSKGSARVEIVEHWIEK
jgi:hypothetical protein